MLVCATLQKNEKALGVKNKAARVFRREAHVLTLSFLSVGFP